MARKCAHKACRGFSACQAPVAPPPASPEPMPEGWEQHEGGYYRDGFWLCAHPRGFELQHGLDDNVQLDLATICALLATQGLTVVTSEEHAKLGILNDPALCWAALEAEMNARGYKFVDESSAKVLEAMAVARIYEMRKGLWRFSHPSEDEQAACLAELARREKEKT